MPPPQSRPNSYIDILRIKTAHPPKELDRPLSVKFCRNADCLKSAKGVQIVVILQSSKADIHGTKHCSRMPLKILISPRLDFTELGH